MFFILVYFITRMNSDKDKEDLTSIWLPLLHAWHDYYKSVALCIDSDPNPHSILSCLLNRSYNTMTKKNQLKVMYNIYVLAGGPVLQYFPGPGGCYKLIKRTNIDSLEALRQVNELFGPIAGSQSKLKEDLEYVRKTALYDAEKELEQQTSAQVSESACVECNAPNPRAVVKFTNNKLCLNCAKTMYKGRYHIIPDDDEGSVNQEDLRKEQEKRQLRAELLAKVKRRLERQKQRMAEERRRQEIEPRRLEKAKQQQAELLAKRKRRLEKQKQRIAEERRRQETERLREERDESLRQENERHRREVERRYEEETLRREEEARHERVQEETFRRRKEESDQQLLVFVSQRILQQYNQKIGDRQRIDIITVWNEYFMNLIKPSHMRKFRIVENAFRVKGWIGVLDVFIFRNTNPLTVGNQIKLIRNEVFKLADALDLFPLPPKCKEILMKFGVDSCAADVLISDAFSS